MSFEQWWAECERLQAEADGLRVRLREVKAERDRWKLKAQLATEQVEEEAESDRFSKEAFDSKCAEVRKLRDALRECHGTEPSVNFRDGKRVEYCPLCDDGTWPCKVARLLASAPEPEEEEEHLKHPTGDYCVYCLSQWPCAEAEGGER